MCRERTNMRTSRNIMDHKEVVQHPMHAETHNIPPDEKTKEKLSSGEQGVGRQNAPCHQEYCSDILGD